MKTGVMVLMMLGAILAVPLALHAQESDPAQVVTAAYEAWNAGDVDAYMALMAPDAVVDMGSFGTHTGAEEIRSWSEGLLPLNPRMEFEILETEGDTVTLTSWYTDDDFRALGIVLEAEEVMVVQDGKITSDTWLVTDESLAELQAVMAGLPETGGNPCPSDALLMALGGLAIVGSLAFERLRS
jgi:ketosteroid isomerase-like protein